MNKFENPKTEGWLDWTKWTECSVSCGVGEEVRYRECFLLTPDNGTAVCEGYKGEDEIEIRTCNPSICLSGEVMVNTETEKARDAGVEDSLFLSRYAKEMIIKH